MKSVSVQFTGTPGSYAYSFDPSQHPIQPTIGMRVVVPMRMKADNTLSLTIATVTSVHDEKIGSADKPVIEFLRPTQIEKATVAVQTLEPK